MNENKTRNKIKRRQHEEKNLLPASFVYQPRHLRAMKDLAYFLLLKQGEAHFECLYIEVSFLQI